MSPVKSRRDEYSDATRASLLDSATRLFAERGYTGTSLEQIAEASRVTKGALYYHFSGKQPLFEAVYSNLEEQALERQQAAAATATSAEGAAFNCLVAFLESVADPVVGRICFIEAPVALGWTRWLEMEEKHFRLIIEERLTAMIDEGVIVDVRLSTLAEMVFHILGGAARRLSDASAEERPKLREEILFSMVRMLHGFRYPLDSVLAESALVAADSNEE